MTTYFALPIVIGDLIVTANHTREMSEKFGYDREETRQRLWRRAREKLIGHFAAAASVSAGAKQRAYSACNASSVRRAATPLTVGDRSQ